METSQPPDRAREACGIVYANEPALTAEGVETVARCAWPPCSVPFVPTRAAHRFHSDACREAAKIATPAWKAAQATRSERAYALNVSYRSARRALREHGVDPDTVSALETLRGKGTVAGWREAVGLPPSETRTASATAASASKRMRATSTPTSTEPAATTEGAPPATGRRGLTADPARPWRATVGPQPEHLRPRAMELRFDLPLRASPRYAAEGLRRHLHAMVTGLLGRPHHPWLPAWALVPLSPSGWGVMFYDPADADRLRGTTHSARVGGWRGEVTLGPAVTRPRTPAPLAPGRYVVTLDAMTAVHHAVMGRARAVTQPTVDTTISAASLALEVAGVTPAGRMHVEAVEAQTLPECVPLGGHSGVVVGWVGRLAITCNAPAAWALQIAARVGFGGKCAYGLGRVRVAVEALTSQR